MKDNLPTKKQHHIHMLDMFGSRCIIGFLSVITGLTMIPLYFQTRFTLEEIFNRSEDFNTGIKLLKGINNVATYIFTIAIIFIFLNIYRTYKKNPICIKHVVGVKLISYLLLAIAVTSYLQNVINNNLSLSNLGELIRPINPLSAIILIFALIVRILSDILKEAIDIKKEHDYTI